MTKEKTLLILSVIGILVSLAYSMRSSDESIGYETYHYPGEQIPASDTYILNTNEMREAAILWLNSKHLPTNGTIRIYPTERASHTGSKIQDGLTIIVERK